MNSKYFQVPKDILELVPEAKDIRLTVKDELDDKMYSNIKEVAVVFASHMLSKENVWKSELACDAKKPWKDTVAKKLLDIQQITADIWIDPVTNIGFITLKNYSSSQCRPFVLSADDYFSGNMNTVYIELVLRAGTHQCSLSFPYTTTAKCFADTKEELLDRLHNEPAFWESHLVEKSQMAHVDGDDEVTMIGISPYLNEESYQVFDPSYEEDRTKFIKSIRTMRLVPPPMK